MLKPISQLTADQCAPAPWRDWRELEPFMERFEEGSQGRKKCEYAVRLLLRIAELTPEKAALDLDWVDATFPRRPKFPLPVKLETYLEARSRVRPMVRRLTGKDFEGVDDGWTDLCIVLHELYGGGRRVDLKMIPLRSTLTNAARARGIQPWGLTQDVLIDLHETATGSAERKSIRTASNLLCEAQERFPEMAAKLVHPLEPVGTKAPTRYLVPFQLKYELDALEEEAARRRWIEIVEKNEVIADGTRPNVRTSLRALMDGFIRSGHLDPEADSCLRLLSDAEALKASIEVQVARARRGEIVMRHVATLMRRLPPVLDRNGVPSTKLREEINKFRELKTPRGGHEMPQETRRFCQAVIENPTHRRGFLRAHDILRRRAQNIIVSASRQNKELSPQQKRQVIHMGTVALFCAIETGGAPIRVRNVLRMTYGAPDAWVRPTEGGFRVIIPAGHVKNRREVVFKIKRDRHAYAETVSWYLRMVRPLILEKAGASKSDWLVPKLSDPSKPCCYETFLEWFKRLMAEEIELPCTPHNFRHGQASLLYHAHPEHLELIARRLGDTTETVRAYYAWVHEESAMAEGQLLLIGLAEEEA